MEHERYERRCGLRQAKRQPRATQPDYISAREMRHANEAAFPSLRARYASLVVGRLESSQSGILNTACGRATREVSPNG